ncbi:hypothetical protein RhiirA4_462055 [Rhizophagus irregularis]|uniref:Uncharacterized protein n=1 Tax=Rhizophagus irregularis TaxID=588596 RepID=A0A2I1GK54_9GLOM|nr:hypothetical protein RhiirA4_462055 [Rhizophagus irregularis]
MEIKAISFIPKDNSAPVFETGSVLRFTGKFSLIEQSPHNMLLEAYPIIPLGALKRCYYREGQLYDKSL